MCEQVKEGARRGHLIWLAVCENCIVTMEYGTLVSVVYCLTLLCCIAVFIIYVLVTFVQLLKNWC
jgi:hypothetical protein